MVATTAPFSNCHRRSRLASLVEHDLIEWTDCMGADWDVVIIGGGAAGIGAAGGSPPRALHLLLEASQRIGGRAWTANVAGQALDLGCGWLHSADRNPLGRHRRGIGLHRGPAQAGLGPAISRPRLLA